MLFKPLDWKQFGLVVLGDRKPRCRARVLRKRSTTELRPRLEGSLFTRAVGWLLGGTSMSTGLRCIYSHMEPGSSYNLAQSTLI